MSDPKTMIVVKDGEEPHEELDTPVRRAWAETKGYTIQGEEQPAAPEQIELPPSD